MISQKSILARLLANENINVQQGNYETAYFDVGSRTLGLPLWKDMGKDVYDMLVGHEVAHAIETPENFHEYEGSKGIPHSWLNIAEDVRIEKLILRRYPGLVGNFKRAYYHLIMERNFFGIVGKDLTELGFWDRLNIHAKARDLVEVPFSDDELPWVARAKKTETYQEVVDFCRDVQEWLKEKKENNPDSGTGNSGNSPDSSGEESDGYISEGDQSDDGQSGGPGDESNDEKSDTGRGDGSDGEKSDGDESGENKAGPGAGEKSDGDESGENKAGPGAGGKNKINSGDPDEEAMTDQAFNENQNELLNDDRRLYAEGLTKEQTDRLTVKYSVVAEARRAEIKNHVKFPDENYTKFLSETKRVVNLMVKEFEMRKAAYRSARARTATKGSLDVTKLHKYRYEDDLFKQVSYLADAKSHGMIMLIDYSGSMYRILPDVIRQLLALVMFCKRVNIPFEVYAFTSGVRVGHFNNDVTRVSTDLSLVELFNSDMSKRDHEEAFKMMFWQTIEIDCWGRPNGSSEYESLGTTPLNAALMAMVHKIKDFRKNHRVQKMNLITLTDGDSNPLYVNYGSDVSNGRRGGVVNGYNVNVDGKILKLSGGYGRKGRETTSTLVRNISEMGVKTVNYFVCSSRGLGAEATHFPDTELKDVRKSVRNDGCFVIDNNLGYDRRFIMISESKSLSGDIEELEIDGDMSAAKIANAFNKVSSSKKKSRIVTKKFAELVA